jgi:hypothetical protein
MKMNCFQKHSTANSQRPTAHGGGRSGRWMLDVFSLRLGCGILLAVLASCVLAAAQTNGVPGPADYSAFSRFIADRNIFDPNRVPHNSEAHRASAAPRSRPTASAPAFSLVGTMSYGKGMFAFFNGNSADLKQALPTGGSIAGYTVTEITLAGVTLQSTNQNQTVALKVGDLMRQENGAWQPAGQGDVPLGENTGSSATPENSPSAAPLPAGGNDILKRLMQQREQELK